MTGRAPDLGGLLALYRGACEAGDGASVIGRAMAGAWLEAEHIAQAAGAEAERAQLDAARAMFAVALARTRALALAALAAPPGAGKA